AGEIPNSVDKRNEKGNHRRPGHRDMKEEDSRSLLEPGDDRKLVPAGRIWHDRKDDRCDDDTGYPDPQEKLQYHRTQPSTLQPRDISPFSQNTKIPSLQQDRST